MFKKLLDEGMAGDNVGLAAARSGAQGHRARAGNREAGLDHAAHEVQGRSVCADEGRRRTTHAVLYRLPAAVLLPDNGRDGSGAPAGRSGDGDAGRQRAMEIELIAPIAMEKGLRFAIREGGRTVGAGTVSEVVE